jgi:site-specific DNA-methyltransferase (adenine-specific)
MIQGETYTVHIGNNLNILPTLPDNSVDSIVTDPPYELGFMGKKWDSSGIAYSVELWTECLRVLKPGGHLLSFGGTRTWHRVAVAIEEAGFEIRDSMAWLYGSGFPKSLDVSKAIDKAAGAEREVLTETVEDLFGEREEEKKEIRTNEASGLVSVGQGERTLTTRYETAPATTEAQQWEGWGTALKPAFEPVVVARKPLIGTVAENVLTHGTGGLNIDGSRIGRKQGDNSSAGNRTATFGTQDTQPGGDGSGGWEQNASGRWPANVILDEYTAELLDEQSGVSKSRQALMGNGTRSEGWNLNTADPTIRGHNDSGGASRFFYVAKASKRDRNEGLEDLPTRAATELTGRREGSKGLSGSSEHGNSTNPFANGGSVEPRQNFHPTVKPTDLMRYLIKLVTPPGGTVLDPFTGSGSTGKAAILEGFRFIGCELTEDYVPIIEGRLKHAELKVADIEAKKEEGLF